MKTLTVNLPANAYDIHIGDGLLGSLGRLLGQYAKEAGRVMVVTDENVARLYRAALEESLAEAGLSWDMAVLPPGEAVKSMEGLALLYDAFAGARLKRGGLVVAFGGGVVGDLAGYAAAGWMRGVRYVQVPTTLLAQVDSSVGGKTAVNLPQGKNLVGAFHQPSMVVIDPRTLDTLPDRELRCGLAEAVKHGAIRSAPLFEALGEGVVDDYTGIIHRCCAIKAEIVGRDERDTGERMALNFGHTFGHAIEKRYGYRRYNHGEGVAMGMVVAAVMGEEMGFTVPDTAQSLRRVLELHRLETALPCGLSELLPILETDKKSGEDGVQMVFLKRIGEAFIEEISFSRMADIIGRVEERCGIQALR